MEMLWQGPAWVLISSLHCGMLAVNTHVYLQSRPAPSHQQASIWKNGGIHPGKALYDWVHGVLASHRAGTLGQLRGKCDLSGIKFEQVATVVMLA